MKKISIKSYAKINIGLNIVGLRPDGYHELDMLMVPVMLHDSVIVNEEPNRKTNSVTMDDFSVILEPNNVVSKAIDKVTAEAGSNARFRVLIHKLIPIQGGFGGGSSNAAAASIAVNKLLKLNFSNEKLKEIITPLGADNPFFINNKPMRCKGKGEIMTPITIKNKYWVIIVKPERGCSTKSVYLKCDDKPLIHPDINSIVKALEEGNDDLLAEKISNSLQEAATSIVPEIDEAINDLKQQGFKIVSMTGSGSGVYALSMDKKLVHKAANKLENKYRVEVTRIIQ